MSAAIAGAITGTASTAAIMSTKTALSAAEARRAALISNPSLSGLRSAGIASYAPPRKHE